MYFFESSFLYINSFYYRICFYNDQSLKVSHKYIQQNVCFITYKTIVMFDKNAKTCSMCHNLDRKNIIFLKFQLFFQIKLF